MATPTLELSRLAASSASDIARWLADGALAIRMGPLLCRIRCDMPDVAQFVHDAYAHHPAVVSPPFADLHVEVCRPLNLRRWMRSQVEFVVDGERPFEPLPREQAPGLLEWGLNWAIAASCHQWLMLHAASLERGGRVVVMPAPPGSGKSTLCAALACRGWRLLSDEITLLDPETLDAHSLARPVNLKNASIELIRSFEPSTRWGPVSLDTVKGRVTHLCPPAAAVERMHETGRPAWIVFPRFVPGVEPVLAPRSRGATFGHLIENAFNYSVLGELGFDAAWRLVQRSRCFDFTYSALDDAMEVFDWLASSES